MWQKVLEILLGEMTLPYFLAMYLCALGGMILFFIKDVRKGIRMDRGTPVKFNWAVMIRMSAFRIIAGLIALFFTVAYYPEITQLVFGAQEPVQINPISAFISGISVDRIIDVLLGYGQEGKEFVKKNGR